MLTDDLYTYEKKSKYQGGSSQCMLCSSENTEDLVHILTVCKTYQDTRLRILLQMEIICLRAKSEINFQNIKRDQTILTQFILDCTSINFKNRIREDDKIKSFDI